jgi:hypothetical protein
MSTTKTTPAPTMVSVTVDNFIRAESDLYFSTVALKEGGFGKFEHKRELMPIAHQTVIRSNRDTLYSSTILDLDAGPATIILPETNGRFMSLQLISEDQYTPPTIYEAGPHTITKEHIGTRYVLAAVRTFVDPSNPKDLDEAHKLQDALRVEQKSPGAFEVPKWDPVSQKKVRDALLVLASTVTDTKRGFGTKDEVDPIQHLIGTASAWGANSPKDAMYLNVTPEKNDGSTVHRLNVKDVPVEGFWSVIVYNAEGYIPQNDREIYSFNNVTAKKDADGSVTIQFGGCDGKAANCIPILPGWNYMVRLYRPRTEILTDKWKFPEAQPVS